MKELNESHFAILRRHMSEVIAINVDKDTRGVVGRWKDSSIYGTIAGTIEGRDGHTWPVVGYRHPNHLVDRVEANANRAAVVHRLRRIEQEIQKHNLEQLDVTKHRG